jgi:hypothetical protein
MNFSANLRDKNPKIGLMSSIPPIGGTNFLNKFRYGSV